MLEALRLDGDERVLEIGLGTGYNAALLSNRLGADRVYSIDVDQAVVESARRRLKECGYEPHTLAADGQAGWTTTAAFDRIIATCSVPSVPQAWISQVRDGGLIVTSLWRDLGGGPLARLEVDRGVAEGRFLSMPGGFMPVRASPRLDAGQAIKAAMKQTGSRHATDVPVDVLKHHDASLWVSLLVPETGWLSITPQDEPEHLWLLALDGSWSLLDTAAFEVEQHGPRQLWTEVERAYTLWQRHGGPQRERLGLTVTHEGAHQFWMDTPANVLWSAP
jgi:SAM-dependent methyltransferase